MRPALLKKIDEFESISELHRSGYSIKEIRQAIRSILEPYISDTRILDSEAIYHLSGEAINVRRIKHDPNGVRFLSQVLEIYWASHRKSAEEATSIVAGFDERVESGKSKYVSLSILEQRKGGMDTETLAHEVFRMMGGVIEGTIRLFLDELLSLTNMGDSRYTPSKVLEMNLGDVVHGLLNAPIDQSFFFPFSYGVSLSQWRNIAQHLDFEVSGDVITVNYGRKTKRSVTLKHEDLIPLGRQIILRVGALKSARVFYSWDNIDRIGPKLKNKSEHPDSVLIDFSAMFLAQGFQIKKVKNDECSLYISVEDIRAEIEDPNARAIHASQFLAMLSRRMPDRDLTIEYVDVCRRKSCRLFLSAHDSEIVAESCDPLNELATRLSIEKTTAH